MQKRESPGVKTHEEIIAIFDALETLEEQIKNPETSADEFLKTKAILQELEPPIQQPEKVIEEPQPIQPAGEIHFKRTGKPTKILFNTSSIEEEPAKRDIKRFAFLKGKKNLEPEPAIITETAPEPKEEKPFRSTFTLELDSNGNLIGLPLKKPKPETEKKGWSYFKRKKQGEIPEQSEEEQPKGIKGIAKKIGSKLRRSKTSEGESSEGIGSKIKGIFRRKTNE
jgi:hypothetical protein